MRGAATQDPTALARAILRERRFRGSSVPRPFHHLLVWLGHELAPLAQPFHWLGRHVPGGGAAVWAALAALVVGIAAVAAWRTARGKLHAIEARARGLEQASRLDPGELERRADAAEREGRHADALRLRFRAGLIRLGRVRVLPQRESLTSGEARRILRLREFDVLARAHDEVVFGGREATVDDARAAREGWRQVLQTVRAR